jgi:hypothetical protein
MAQESRQPPTPEEMLEMQRQEQSGDEYAVGQGDMYRRIHKAIMEATTTARLDEIGQGIKKSGFTDEQALADLRGEWESQYRKIGGDAK